MVVAVPASAHTPNARLNSKLTKIKTSDNIEANIYSFAQHTQDASTQLTKAARYQKSSRGRAVCLLIILVVVLTVILLGVSCNRD